MSNHLRIQEIKGEIVNEFLIFNLPNNEIFILTS